MGYVAYSVPFLWHGQVVFRDYHLGMITLAAIILVCIGMVLLPKSVAYAAPFFATAYWLYDKAGPDDEERLLGCLFVIAAIGSIGIFANGLWHWVFG